MFCRNCGKEHIVTPEFCMGCGARPLVGTSFCQACGSETSALAEICIKCGAQLVKGELLNISPKSRVAATLLTWFLGIFGAHRFYLGKTGTAVVMLILGIAYLATVWIYGIGFIFLVAVGIWTLVDFIHIIVGKMKDKEGKIVTKW